MGLISFSSECTAKRWSTTTNNIISSSRSGNDSDHNDKNEKSLEVVGVYKGHTSLPSCAIEIDDNTIATRDVSNILKVWDKATCECLRSVPAIGQVHIGLKNTKPSGDTYLICETIERIVEARRLRDFSTVAAIKLNAYITWYV